MPWEDDITITAAALDLDYYGIHSGNKIISPLVDLLVEENTNYELTQLNMNELSELLYNKYVNDWKRMWQALRAEYNPINNYDMIEKETIDKEATRKPNLTTNETITPKTTNTTTRKPETVQTSEILNDTTTSDNDVYGYNSTTPAPESKNTQTHTSKSTVGTSGTETVTSTNGGDTKTQKTEIGTEDTNEDVERELTRSGNIGVTTSAEMVQQETDLRAKNNYFNYVYDMIDKILTIPIYC